MKLVQVVKSITNPSSENNTPAALQFEVVADFDSVPNAMDAISADQLGDGPFDIVTVNRKGVKLQSVTEKVLDTGTAFGARTARAPSKPAPKAPKAPSTGSKSDPTSKPAK